MGVMLSIRNISKELNNQPVLKNISFDIEQGDIFGIIGVSGSGKSTLLNHLVGYHQPTQGNILYKYKQGANDIHQNLQQARSIIGYSPQDPSFYPNLSIKENLVHFSTLYTQGEPNLKFLKYLLQITGLLKHHKKLASQLSGGMQRRLSIVCSMVHNPQILLLDEPTADLDPIARDETWKILKSLNEKGKTVVVASHLLDELEQNCNKVAVIHNGELLLHGPVEQLKEGMPHAVIINTDINTQGSILKAINKQHVQEITRDQQSLTIKTNHPYEVLNQITNQKKQFPQVQKIRVDEPKLSVAFDKLVRK